MSIGSGLSGSFGMAPEVTFGAYVAATRHLEVQDAKIRETKQTVQSKGLAAGRQVPLASRRVVTSRAASGPVNMEVVNTKMGLIFNQFVGGTVTPVQQGATSAYLQTHNLTSTVDNKGKSFSAQVGIADALGTVRPHTFLGCKIPKLELSCGVDEYLMLSMDVDAREFTAGQTLVAPSYAATTRPFHWGEGAFRIADQGGSPAAIDGVRKVSMSFERKMDTGRYYYGSGGRKAEPILNDFASLTGAIDGDYVTKADLADRYSADSPFALEWEFVGPLIASTYYETFRVTAPACYFDDAPPTLDGPDLAKLPMKFTILNDATNPPVKIEIISIDVAI